MEQRKLVTPADIKTALKEVGVQKGQAIMEKLRSGGRCLLAGTGGMVAGHT